MTGPHRTSAKVKIALEKMTSLSLTLFLEHTVYLTAHHDTPLHFACFRGKLDVAQLLLDHGAQVNVKNHKGETPLHLASRLMSLEAAWILLKYGADLNAENFESETPFQLARRGMREKMEQLRSDNSIGRSRRAKCVALMGLLYEY